MVIHSGGSDSQTFCVGWGTKFVVTRYMQPDIACTYTRRWPRGLWPGSINWDVPSRSGLETIHSFNLCFFSKMSFLGFWGGGSVHGPSTTWNWYWKLCLLDLSINTWLVGFSNH